MGRDKILQTIRENKTKVTPLPKTITDTNLKEKFDSGLINRFKEILQHVGGDYFEVNGTEELNAFTERHFSGAANFRKKEMWKRYPPDCPKENIAQLKTVILEVQFGVAENGAVWVDESNFPNRLLPFIAEELIVCLDSKQIISDMHEAYFRIANKVTGFGVFISGPSKTADIEQNLVFGAHGAKKTTVILY